MQKFLEVTLMSDYIKALLESTPLPKYKSISVGDYVVKDCLYIYKQMLIKATTTGVFTGLNYIEQSEYMFGKDVTKLTGYFKSIEDFYDSTTHERLGDYLRLYRDTYGIDLMPFYNCYSGVYSSSFYISNRGNVLQQTENKFKVLSLPIKLNTTYTIAIDSDSSIKLSPAFINNSDFLFIGDTNLTESFEKAKNQSMSVASTRFLAPFTYKVTNSTAVYERYEKYLRLLIQIPYSCTSSIVVLEGDYTNCNHLKYMNAVDNNGNPILETKTEKEINKLFIYRPNLLKMNDRETYAFSDRLVEYLLRNVITSQETITNNVERVQNIVSLGKNYNDYFKDAWDIYLRKQLYYRCVESDKTLYDINGFVDKDVEKYLDEVLNNGN